MGGEEAAKPCSAIGVGGARTRWTGGRACQAVPEADGAAWGAGAVIVSSCVRGAGCFRRPRHLSNTPIPANLLSP
ncbi:hypothetical protein AB6O49_02950 [Streptomyces sp. SBR177]